MVDHPTRHSRTAAPSPSTGAAAPHGDAADLPTSYGAALERLLAGYRAIPSGATVRLAKRTSNLFRGRPARDAPGLDVSGLQGVLAVDATARTADVRGMCTYEDLVAETLKYGLAPLVVPQLKTITVGGADHRPRDRIQQLPQRATA